MRRRFDSANYKSTQIPRRLKMKDASDNLSLTSFVWIWMGCSFWITRKTGSSRVIYGYFAQLLYWTVTQDNNFFDLQNNIHIMTLQKQGKNVTFSSASKSKWSILYMPPPSTINWLVVSAYNRQFWVNNYMLIRLKIDLAHKTPISRISIN